MYERKNFTHFQGTWRRDISNETCFAEGRAEYYIRLLAIGRLATSVNDVIVIRKNIENAYGMMVMNQHFHRAS